MSETLSEIWYQFSYITIQTLKPSFLDNLKTDFTKDIHNLLKSFRKLTEKVNFIAVKLKIQVYDVVK